MSCSRPLVARNFNLALEILRSPYTTQYPTIHRMNGVESICVDPNGYSPCHFSEYNLSTALVLESEESQHITIFIPWKKFTNELSLLLKRAYRDLNLYHLLTENTTQDTSVDILLADNFSAPYQRMNNFLHLQSPESNSPWVDKYSGRHAVRCLSSKNAMSNTLSTKCHAKCVAKMLCTRQYTSLSTYSSFLEICFCIVGTSDQTCPKSRSLA